MKRCYNTKNTRFKNYGQRGIRVCKAWHNIHNFIADMGERPHMLTLDRIDVNGDYSKENCRWATLTQQARNKTNTRLITVRGKTKHLIDWARRLKLYPSSILSRINSGWTLEEAVTTPKAARFR